MRISDWSSDVCSSDLTLHTVFARGVSFADPIDIHVDRMQAGRSFASSTVTISQGDRLCVRSSVLMSATEPDLIRHSDVIAAASTPEDSTATSEGDGDWQVRVGGGVDIDDPTDRKRTRLNSST